MATTNAIESLKKTAQDYSKINMEKLIRANLGDESLQHTIEPLIKEIQVKLDFAINFAQWVPEGIVNAIRGLFDSLRQQLETHAGRSNPDYVSNRQPFIDNIKNTNEQLLQHWHYFVSAAVEKKGILADEGVKKAYEAAVKTMQEEATKSLTQLKEDSSKVLEEARHLAQQIENRARLTAAKISVRDAQQQFSDAEIEFNKQIKLWSWLSGISLVLFLLIAIYFMQIPLPEQWNWHVIYYTAIRITIISAVGAIGAFCLRILRANLHMRQHNLHRKRLANSMSSFIESATTPEQRDIILEHLVDAIAHFGTSGLLTKEDDTVINPKLTIDNLVRTLSQPSGKS
ncbi:hypothetical protein HUU42_07220 [bacterium]|nr:hypothetical protein [bacterium]